MIEQKQFIDTEFTTVKEDIKNLKSSQNSGSASTPTPTVVDNKPLIDKNIADIKVNIDNIAKNKTTIDKNIKNIKSNTENIKTNKTAIDKNIADIKINTDNIATNKKDIEDIKEDYVSGGEI